MYFGSDPVDSGCCSVGCSLPPSSVYSGGHRHGGSPSRRLRRLGRGAADREKVVVVAAEHVAARLALRLRRRGVAREPRVRRRGRRRRRRFLVGRVRRPGLGHLARPRGRPDGRRRGGRRRGRHAVRLGRRRAVGRGRAVAIRLSRRRRHHAVRLLRRRRHGRRHHRGLLRRRDGSGEARQQLLVVFVHGAGRQEIVHLCAASRNPSPMFKPESARGSVYRRLTPGAASLYCNLILSSESKACAWTAEQVLMPIKACAFFGFLVCLTAASSLIIGVNIANHCFWGLLVSDYSNLLFYESSNAHAAASGKHKLQALAAWLMRSGARTTEAMSGTAATIVMTTGGGDRAASATPDRGARATRGAATTTTDAATASDRGAATSGATSGGRGRETTTGATSGFSRRRPALRAEFAGRRPALRAEFARRRPALRAAVAVARRRPALRAKVAVARR